MSRNRSLSLNWLELQGTFGEFRAPGSETSVSYLLTHASLGHVGTGNTQLTKHLVPMRELFDIGDLNFDELLQRDLDDHRVAAQIIPYLLKKNPSARFFPPILAVILPVMGQNALEQYPQRDLIEEIEKDKNGQETGHIKETVKFGQVFEVERYRDKNGNFFFDALLRLNPDQVRIIVLDGQHRAMAILAIRRSQTGDWGDRGSDYKHFYEDIAVDLKEKNIIQNLEKVELPVCLAYLPEISIGSSSTITLIQAFRKLFLDVNKEARKPTRARQLLLDDSNIISIFSRAILSEVRNEGQIQGATSYSIDLDSFEYDSPRESPKPQRELAFCTIEMIYEIVRWALFSEDEYYLNPNKSPSAGRPPINLSRFLSEIRADEKITSTEINSWGFGDLENELIPTDVPSACHIRLSGMFMDAWGKQIIYLISNLHPMVAHIKAVAGLRAAHISETGHGKLAWRALFDGQGIYWTIRKYTEHRRRKSSNFGKQLPITDVENAYDAITLDWIPNEFEPNRARFYWNKKECSSEEEAIAKRSFQIFRTMAFQIGFVMAVALLKKSLKIIETSEFTLAIEEWINAWNQAFNFHPKSENGKRSLSMFDPAGNGLMARHFGRLQKSEWIWFRYFAFEMLDAVSDKFDFKGKEIVRDMLSKMRLQYIEKLGGKIQIQEKRKGNDISREDALKEASHLWKDTLNNSLGVKKKDFEDWLKTNIKSALVSTGNNEEDENYSENGLTENGFDDDSDPEIFDTQKI